MIFERRLARHVRPQKGEISPGMVVNAITPKTPWAKPLPLPVEPEEIASFGIQPVHTAFCPYQDQRAEFGGHFHRRTLVDYEEAAVGMSLVADGQVAADDEDIDRRRGTKGGHPGVWQQAQFDVAAIVLSLVVVEDHPPLHTRKRSAHPGQALQRDVDVRHHLGHSVDNLTGTRAGVQNFAFHAVL